MEENKKWEILEKENQAGLILCLGFYGQGQAFTNNHILSMF